MPPLADPRWGGKKAALPRGIRLLPAEPRRDLLFLRQRFARSCLPEHSAYPFARMNRAPCASRRFSWYGTWLAELFFVPGGIELRFAALGLESPLMRYSVSK